MIKIKRGNVELYSRVDELNGVRVDTIVTQPYREYVKDGKKYIQDEPGQPVREVYYRDETIGSVHYLQCAYSSPLILSPAVMHNNVTY